MKTNHLKIALVRGASLNDWELQTYLPLQKNHEITVFGSRWGEYPFSLPFQTRKLWCSGEIARFIPGGITWLYKTFGDPQMLIGLEQVLKGFDIVHCAERTSYYTLQAIYAKQKGWIKKVVVTCWENILHVREDYPGQLLMKREIDRNADWFIAGSYKARSVLMAEGIPSRKITIVPVGIDLTRFKPAVRKKAQDKIIVCPARMIVGKGIYDVFRAAKNILEVLNLPHVRFIMIGDGPEKDRLHFLAQLNGISDRFEIRSFVPYRTLLSIYQQADIVILPSIPTRDWQEQNAWVLIESMAVGTPVIATRIGSVAETVGDAGLLVPPGDVLALTQAIKKLLFDATLARQLSQKSVTRVKQLFDAQKIARQIELVYFHALSQ